MGSPLVQLVSLILRIDFLFFTTSKPNRVPRLSSANFSISFSSLKGWQQVMRQGAMVEITFVRIARV